MAGDKIYHIEKLRAFSILLVLMFHLEMPGFQNGFLGVDVFFVISGFLMATLYGEIATRPEIQHYFRRRMARILPAYYAVILLTVACSFFLLLPHEIQMVMEQSVWAAFFLPNIGYWLDTSYFDHTNLRPLLNLWSLGIEVQFYLLFPLLLFIERRSRLLLAVLAAGSCVEYAILNSFDPKSAFFLLPGRLWEFMAGFYAARLGPRLVGALPVKRHLIGATAVGLVLLLLLTAPSFSRDYTFLATLAVVLLTAVAISFGFATGREEGFLSRGLNVIGQYSYSIYLVHFPIIVAVMYTPFGGTNLTPTGTNSVLVALVLTAVVSYLFYNFIEVRTRKSLTGMQLVYVSVVFCVMSIAIARPLLNLSQELIDPKLWNLSNALNDRDGFRCAAATDDSLSAGDSCLISELPAAVLRHNLLVGDSHADAIKGPLADFLAANNQSLRLMSKNEAVNSQYPVRRIIDEALEQGIETIILHSIENEIRPDAIEELIVAAAAQGLTVAFIDPVPIYTFNVPAHLLEDYRRSHALLTRAEPYSTVNFDGELHELAQRYDNFHRFKTRHLFCDDDCRISNEAGNPYYFDTNHLTLTGATLLLPVFHAISELD